MNSSSIKLLFYRYNICQICHDRKLIHSIFCSYMHAGWGHSNREWPNLTILCLVYHHESKRINTNRGLLWNCPFASSVWAAGRTVQTPHMNFPYGHTVHGVYFWSVVFLCVCIWLSCTVINCTLQIYLNFYITSK